MYAAQKKEPIDFTLLCLLYLLLFYVSHWPEVFVITKFVGELSRVCTGLTPVEFYSVITVGGGKTEKIHGSSVGLSFPCPQPCNQTRLALHIPYTRPSATQHLPHTHRKGKALSLLFLLNKSR